MTVSREPHPGGKMQNVKIHRSIAKLKDVDLFYFDTKTDGPTVVCLHGRWGRAEAWYDFIQHYGVRYRIIAPDQRGHGLSGKPVCKYTAEEMAEDVRELLDFLGIDTAVVVGHSMGGRVAGYFAAMYPERVKALALLDKSAARLSPPNALTLEQIPAVDPLTADWPLPFSSIYEAMDFIRANTESALSYQYFMNSLTETAEGYRMLFSPQAMAANIAFEEEWFHLLPGYRFPVLVLRARGGDAVSDEDFAKMRSMITGCMAREVSNPDHNVHLANKEEFYGYFDEFLTML